MSPKHTYDPDFKKAVVIEFLKFRQEDPHISTKGFIEQHHPEINVPNLYNWISKYKELAMTEAGLAPNEAESKYGTTANDLSLKAKLAILLETSNLSEEDFGTYCRQKGLYAADIKRWRSEIEFCCDQSSTAAGNAKALRELKEEYRQCKEDLQKEQALSTKLQREIAGKDKTLATYAAKITLMRNFPQLFGVPEED